MDTENNWYLGVGVSSGKPKSELSKAVDRRVEMLGKMNDRRKNYLDTENWDGLRELAAEYANLGAVTTANEVYKDIPTIQEEKANEQVSET